MKFIIVINEQLTVQQVADICKKINKNLQITYYKRCIPNLGYSLSNDKIKKAGFRFLYKIEPSIREMIESWSDKPLLIRK